MSREREYSTAVGWSTAKTVEGGLPASCPVSSDSFAVTRRVLRPCSANLWDTSRIMTPWALAKSGRGELRWSRDLRKSPIDLLQGSPASCRPANWPISCMAFPHEHQDGPSGAPGFGILPPNCDQVSLHAWVRQRYPLRSLPHILGGAILGRVRHSVWLWGGAPGGRTVRSISPV